MTRAVIVGSGSEIPPTRVTNAMLARVMDTTPVSRIMIQNPITISEETSLEDAARTLHTMKFGALPVTRDGRLVGIVTDSDLLRCLIDLLAHGG